MIAVNEFKKLPKEKKIKLCLDILNNISEENEFFSSIKALISFLKEDISDDLLNNFYGLIYNLIDSLLKERKIQDIEKFKKLQSKLKKIANTGREEIDLDKLLENI